MWCDSCHTSNYNNNCLYYILNAYWVNLEVTMNNIIETMIETMKENMFQCFNQRREDYI